MIRTLAAGLCCWLTVGWTLGKDNKDPEYTNTWVANIQGGEEVAQSVARTLGYTYKGQMGSFKDYYELVKEDHPPVSLRHSDHLTSSLRDLDEVKWAEQQRVMRIAYKDQKEGAEKAEDDNVVHYPQQEATIVAKGLSRFFSKLKGLFSGNAQDKLGTFSTRPAPPSQLHNYKGPTKNIELLKSKVSAYKIFFKDPLWKNQWYMQDYRTTDIPVMDHNVVPVYRMGFTGKGVTVAVVDDAVQIDHPDLQQNIDLKNSYDMCLDRPYEQVKDTYEPKTHGTSCAGIIGMVGKNDLCGVGVAYHAKIAVMNNHCKDKRPASDTAKCLTKNLDQIDIYSNSWGSEDDASSVFKLDELLYKAYETGGTQGRKGRGAIYVHSAGGGGLSGDNCAADGFVNHPFIIGITSANQYGKRCSYSERCTGIFATTYSGEVFKKKDVEGVVTLGPGGKCMDLFIGTSASCSLAAGIIALTLQANPDLSYRDVMHIIANSAEVAPLANNANTWYRNGQGFWVSNDFGFGLMNAENMVILAHGWKKVAERQTCTVTERPRYGKRLSANRKVTFQMFTDGCKTDVTHAVRYIEHIEVSGVVKYPVRGAIKIFITSPQETRSLLLEPRTADKNREGLKGWRIMSTHNWGENPKGRWTIDVEVEDTAAPQDAIGLVEEFTIQFHGLAERYIHLNQIREYAAFRLPDGQTEDATFIN